MKGPSTTLLERPPPGPARGAVAAPAWFIAVLSAVLVLLAGYSLLRAYRRRVK